MVRDRRAVRNRSAAIDRRDVVVNRMELSIPPSITLQQAAGFNLYMLKAIYNGRADEVLDLAKTNLFR